MSTSTLASLIVRFAANTGDFETDVGRAARVAEKRAKDIEESFKKMGAAVGLAAAAAATAVVLAVRESINEFDNLAKTSQKIGTTVESLSTLQYAAAQSGVEINTLQSAMTKLAVKANDAAAGNKEAASVFAALGVSIRDAGGNIKTTDVLLREAAEKFKGFTNNSQEAALAVKLFGRSGAELLPMLNAGAEGIAELEDRARSMGLEIGTTAAKQAEVFNDAMSDLRFLAKGYANDVATEVLPALAGLAQHLADSGIAAREAAGGTTWLGEAIKNTLAFMIAMKGAVEKVAITFAHAATMIDIMIDSTKRSMAIIGESFGVYGRLLSDGPVAAYQYLMEIQDKFAANAQESLGAAARETIRYHMALAENSAETAKALDSLIEGAKGTADALDESSDAAKTNAPVIADAGTAAAEAAKATRAHAQAVREAARELRDATKRYDDYLERMKEVESAGVDASEALDEYIQDSNAWLNGADDAALRHAEALRDLLEIEEALVKAGRDSVEVQQALARARQNASDIRNVESNAAAGVFGGGVNNLEDVLRNAVRAAFDQRNLAGFFRNIKEAFGNAFTRRQGEGTGAFVDRATNALQQGVNFLQGAAAAWEAGQTTLESVVNVAAMIPGTVGQIAQVIQGINALAGGRLLGTAATRDSSRRNISLGADGATGSDSVTTVRQRSLFRGRSWSTTTSALDADTQRSINQLFDQIADGVGSAASLLGVAATDIVSASFQQDFDKDGNLVKEFGTILGRTFNEGFDEFAQRIQAENILAVIAEAFPTDGIGAIAEQWRDSGESLLEGASALLAVAASVKDGTSIFTGSLSSIIDMLDQFGEAGESLFETYQRIVQAAMSYGQAVASVQEELMTESLSKFSRAVLAARRQELQRIETLNALARTTGLLGAREQDLDAVRAASAARVQVLIRELTTDALGLVSELYAPVTNAGKPPFLEELDPLPEAFDRAAEAMAAFRQSVSDFMRGLELDEQLSPFGAMERLQRARAMLRDAAGRGDLQSAQQLASATLNIGRDLFASGRDYNRLFEEVQSILAGVQYIAPVERPSAPSRPDAPSVPGFQDAQNRVRIARELAQAVADLAAEQGMTFAEVAASLGFNLDQLGTDLGLSTDGLLSYLESLQADTVNLAQVLTDLPLNIARELAALLQGAVGVAPGDKPRLPESGTAPIAPGTIPGGPVSPNPPGFGPGFREPEFGDGFIRQSDNIDVMTRVSAQLDQLITETRVSTRSNEEALQPIREEITTQRFLLEDSMASNRSVR